MAYVMTKQGSQDNVLTYEFMCDKVADLESIEKRYRTLGSIAIVVGGDDGLEVYIAGSDRSWVPMGASAVIDPSAQGSGLSLHICGQDEVYNGLPDIDEPDDTTIYLVAASEETNNLYDEYIYVDGEWEKFGGGSVDLSGVGHVELIDTFDVELLPDWVASTAYAAGAQVRIVDANENITGYKCITANEDAEFTASKWYEMSYAPAQGAAHTIYIAKDTQEIWYWNGASYYKATDTTKAPINNPVFTGSISLGRKANTTIGNNSVAMGYNVTAPGQYTYAEGYETTAALGSGTHAEGYQTVAAGNGAHVEGIAGSGQITIYFYPTYNPSNQDLGRTTSATQQITPGSNGPGTHAEGSYTSAAGGGGQHAEGSRTYATGSQGQHAEGYEATATGSQGQHAEGVGTLASGNLGQHAEGAYCTAIGQYGEHAEGNHTYAGGGGGAHAEGSYSCAINIAAHAEGYKTQATGWYAHSEGHETVASAYYTHAAGKQTTASGDGAHSEGRNTTAHGEYSHAEGGYTVANGNYSHAEGYGISISDPIVYQSTNYTDSTRGNYGHAEGYQTCAYGQTAHAEGYRTLAKSDVSHSEGYSTVAAGYISHAEGLETDARGAYSHAEGCGTVTTGFGSHTAGFYNVIDDYTSWAEWVSATSYSVGDKVKRTITNNDVTTITGYICKTANEDVEFTAAKWNTDNKINYGEIIGNGTAGNARSNARALDWSGNEYLKGDLYVGCNADSTGGTKVTPLPASPVSDGTYTLQCTVSSGVATYSWVSTT